MRGSGAVCQAACTSVGGDRRSTCSGGRPGGWPVVLSWLWRAAGRVGVRARAGGADARRGSVAAAAASVLSGVRGNARAAARMVGAAQARWGRGDRRRAAGQGPRCWASHDRRAARSPAGNGPRLAARVHPPRRGPQLLSATVGIRDRRDVHAGQARRDRRSRTPSRRSARRSGRAARSSGCAPGRGSWRSR